MRLLTAVVGCLGALATAFGPAAWGQMLASDQREQIARSVAQIQARDCAGQADRSGSGFLWKSDHELVTALHVVAGCTTIDAFFERLGGLTRRARIEHVLQGVDLALLSIEGVGAPPLRVATRQPEVSETLEAIGFYLGVPSMGNKELKVAFGLSRLGDMLPEQLYRQVKAGGGISPDIEIIRLNGHLLPGLSGAPILDTQGEVMGIGSGGLESGAAAVSWALPLPISSGCGSHRSR